MWRYCYAGKSVPLLLSLLCLLSACGVAGPAAQTSPASPQQPGASLDACDPLYIVADSPEAARPFELEKDALCRLYGVRPVLRNPPYLATELDHYVAEAGEQVDLIILPPRMLSVYVEQGLIRPIDPWIAKDEPWYTDILPVYRNLYMRFDGQDYGFVYDGDSHLLFYRQDLFRKRGLTVPRTWSEYDQVARTLGGTEGYGTAMVGAEDKAYIWFVERYASFGGEYFDGQMRPLINGPLGVRVLTDLVTLQQETAPEAAYDWADLNRALLAGTIPMVIQWSDTARFSYDHEVWNSQVADLLSWDVVPGEKPGAPQGGIWFGRVLAIAARSRKPEAAAAAARYITGPEVSSRMITRADTINDPYRYSHFEHPETQSLFPSTEVAESLYGALQKTLRRPMADLTIPGGWDYTQALDRAVLKALRGEATPGEALTEAARQWESITERLGREPQAKAYHAWWSLVNGEGASW